MMDNNSYEDEHIIDNLSGFFAGLLFLGGLLLGGLVGAGAMLLLAPQSGKKTRTQIRRKGRDLRKQTTKGIEDGVDQVRAKAHQVTTSIHDQAEDLQQRSQDVVDQQKERWSSVVEAGKTAVQGS
jgi:gas vesicle protein